MVRGSILSRDGAVWQCLRRSMCPHPLFALILGMCEIFFVFFSPAVWATESCPGGREVMAPAVEKECPHQHVSSQPSRPRVTVDLPVIVVDENGVAVPSVHLVLEQSHGHSRFKGETDYAGRYTFVDLLPGAYRFRAEKEGFYAAILDDVRVGQISRLEITLNHQREFVEVMDVHYSPPAIDPLKAATEESLSDQEIVNLPYPTTRDIRNILPLMPGVLQDATGQIHINGSATEQIFSQLDGFHITHPVTGQLTLRVNADAVRRIEVQSSRYSAEYGKGSGGTLNLLTGMGDDRYRFSATNFIPSLQNRKGIHLKEWTPRATFSGPLRRGRAWFFVAPDGEYNLNIVNELPAGADRNRVWRLNNLAKAQVNWTSSNILTTSFLINRFGANHAGLSPFNPLETTVNQSRRAFLFTLKNQTYFSGGWLLDIGWGVSEFRTDDRPMGDAPYIIRPEGTEGNFFKQTVERARRHQWIANLYLPPATWHGRHEFKVGIDLDAITFWASVQRRPILVQRQDGTLARRITFVTPPRFGRRNVEVSSYVQDRWLMTRRLLMELGVRFDWDEIVRRFLVSPRLASSWLLTADGQTKLAIGVGLFYDASHLALITRPLAGRRFDEFFDERGQPRMMEPLETMFRVNERSLRAPRFLNWSIGVERKLPASLYLRVEFVQKRGRHGWAFINRGGVNVGQREHLLELASVRRDRYDALQVALRRTLRERYKLFASYTRSSARSNAVLDFNLDNPLFSQQMGGRLPWDAPNRFLSWGWLPLVKGFNLGYTVEWRDGYPFNVVNEDQQLVEPPSSRRFPDYFSLNVHLERRFRLFGFQWALRAGFNNLTDHANPTVVNNNIDSPDFLTFAGLRGRTFTGRIRFLGRK